MREELEALLEVPISLNRAATAVRVLHDECDCDPEWAHNFEDRFRASVLETISNHSERFAAGVAAELAKLALSTREIKFPRWCA